MLLNAAQSQQALAAALYDSDILMAAVLGHGLNRIKSMLKSHQIGPESDDRSGGQELGGLGEP